MVAQGNQAAKSSRFREAPVQGNLPALALLHRQGLLHGLPINITASVMFGGLIVGNVMVLTGKAAIDQVLGEE